MKAISASTRTFFLVPYSCLVISAEHFSCFFVGELVCDCQILEVGVISAEKSVRDLTCSSRSL